MTCQNTFLSQAMRVIGEAAIAVIGLTDLHVRTTPLPKRLASRASARIRTLEQMLRRVIVLMALAILPGLPAPLLKRPFISIAGLAGPQPVARPKLRAGASGPRTPGLPPISGARDLPVFSQLPATRSAPRAVSAARLVARLQTLQRILENPGPMAKRLAAGYARLKANCKLLPAFMPGVPLRGGPAELKLIAGALPLELRRARAVLNDTS